MGKKFFTNKINFSSTKHSCNFQGNFLNREASLAFDNFSADITLNPSLYLMNETNAKTASKNLKSSSSQKKSRRYLHSLSLEQNNEVIPLLIFIICLVEKIYKKSKFL